MADLAVKVDNLPAHLKGIKSKGVEVPSDEVSLPYLTLAQASGRAVKEGKNKYGDIFNSVTNKSFGKEVEIAIIKYRRDWKEFDESGQLLRSSDDGKNWKNGDALSEDHKWQCKFYNYFVIVTSEDSNIPYILSLGHSSAKTGKAILNIIAQTTNAMGLPSYAKTFKLSTKEETKDKNAYMVWKAVQSDTWADEKTVARCAAIEKMLNSVKVREEEPVAEPVAKEANPF